MQLSVGGPRFFEPSVVWAMWRREILHYARDRSQIFGGFSRTILWLVILGFGLGAALRDIEGYTYTQYVLPGVVLLNILFASMQSAFALVWDRKTGLLRQILVSPASRLSIVTGKLLGGASVAVVQGTIPFIFAPFVGIQLSLSGVLAALAVMAAMAVMLTAFGIVIAVRIRSLQSFGSVSNGIIQPLYFLSGSIFPLKGVIGGIGFLDIPPHLREELRRLGIHAFGGAWVVELPEWLRVLVYANPVSYGLDLLRYAVMGFHQLPLTVNFAIVMLLPPLSAVLAAWALARSERLC